MGCSGAQLDLESAPDQGADDTLISYSGNSVFRQRSISAIGNGLGRK